MWWTREGLTQWSWSGRVWIVGDDVGIDTHIMPLRAVRERVWDPEVLGQWVFEESHPEIGAGAAPGDFIVAGKRFAKGNPHHQGWVGLRHRGLSVLAESVPRGAFRTGIGAGVPILTGSVGLPEHVQPGQRLTVDFESGIVVAESDSRRFHFPPLAPELRKLVAVGGTAGWLEDWARGERGAASAASGTGEAVAAHHAASATNHLDEDPLTR